MNNHNYKKKVEKSKPSNLSKILCKQNHSYQIETKKQQIKTTT